MHTAILSSESEVDFNLIIQLATKLKINTKELTDDYFEADCFQNANESSLTEWLTKEEDEAWKNL